jgi:hypothetical protein
VVAAISLPIYAEPEPEASAWRPRTRGDCASVPRPCPYVGCKYHLGVDVGRGPGGSTAIVVREAFQDREPWDLRESAPSPLRRIAHRLNITPERARQLQHAGLARAARMGLRLAALIPTATDRGRP